MSDITWIGKRFDQGDYFQSHYLVSGPSPDGLQWLFKKGEREAIRSEEVFKALTRQGRISRLTVYDESWLATSAPKDMPAMPFFNSAELLSILSNKILLRSQKLPVPLIPGQIVEQDEVSYTKCQTLFTDATSFVLHGAVGSACNNIRVIRSSRDDHQIKKMSGERIIVTPLKGSAVPFNIHLIIGERNTSVAPPSLQILNQDGEGQITYGGCDFSAARFLSTQMLRRIEEFGVACAEWMRATGYRGIAGADFLIEGDDITLVEINPRYQASTGVLNLNLFRTIGETCQSLHVAGRGTSTLPRLAMLKCYGAMTVRTRIPQAVSDNRWTPNSTWDETERHFHLQGVAVPPFTVFPQPNAAIRECSDHAEIA